MDEAYQFNKKLADVSILFKSSPRLGRSKTRKLQTQNDHQKMKRNEQLEESLASNKHLEFTYT